MLQARGEWGDTISDAAPPPVADARQPLPVLGTIHRAVPNREQCPRKQPVCNYTGCAKFVVDDRRARVGTGARNIICRVQGNHFR